MFLTPGAIIVLMQHVWDELSTSDVILSVTAAWTSILWVTVNWDFKDCMLITCSSKPVWMIFKGKAFPGLIVLSLHCTLFSCNFHKNKENIFFVISVFLGLWNVVFSFLHRLSDSVHHNLHSKQKRKPQPLSAALFSYSSLWDSSQWLISASAMISSHKT